MDATWTGHKEAASRTNRLAYIPGYLGLILGAAALLLVTRPAGPAYGGGVFPAVDPQEQARDAARVPVLPDGFVGVRVTNSANQTAAGPLTFDTVRWDTGFYDPAQPTRVTFPVSGICEVRAQVTILGTAYFGPPADSVVLSVKRDGDASAFVAFSRLSNQDPAPAGGLSASTTDWFEAGEYLEVFVSEGLLVEANWPGRSNVSPVLTVVC